MKITQLNKTELLFRESLPEKGALLYHEFPEQYMQRSRAKSSLKKNDQAISNPFSTINVFFTNKKEKSVQNLKVKNLGLFEDENIKRINSLSKRANTDEKKGRMVLQMKQHEAELKHSEIDSLAIK